jgi:hypothetical protein
MLKNKEEKEREKEEEEEEEEEKERKKKKRKRKKKIHGHLLGLVSINVIYTKNENQSAPNGPTAFSHGCKPVDTNGYPTCNEITKK